MDGTPTTGPTTFAEAFAADASSASTPSETTGAASASADATVPPATSATPEGSPQLEAGEPPRERWPTILENARKKAADEERAAWQQYAWVKEPQKIAAYQEMVRLGELYQQNPIGYAKQFFAEMMSHPEHGQSFRSELARALGTRQQAQAAPAVDLQPKLVQLEDGSTVPLYSQEQIDAVIEQRMAKLRQELQPTVQTAQELQRARREAAEKAQADTWARGFMSSLRKLPDYEALEPTVIERLKDFKPTTGHQAEIEAAAYRIYLELTHERKATDIAKAKSDQLDDLRRQAAASTAPNPGSAAPSTPKNVRKFSDLPASAWK